VSCWTSTRTSTSTRRNGTRHATVLACSHPARTLFLRQRAMKKIVLPDRAPSQLEQRSVLTGRAPQSSSTPRDQPEVRGPEPAKVDRPDRVRLEEKAVTAVVKRSGALHCLWDGKQFTPTPSLSGTVTEHFCSPTCAWASLQAKQREVLNDNGRHRQQGL